MFNGNEGYSLADIAAATGNNNNGFGDNGAWWIVILFLFCFTGGWGNRGYGLFGSGESTGSGITDGYILTSDFANIERKIDGVNTGLCDGFYAMNTGMLNGFAGIQNSITQQTIASMQDTNALSTQLANCCCENKTLTMQSNYDAAARSTATDTLIAQNFATLNYNLADQSCQTRRAIADSTRDMIANQDANTRAILDFMTQDKIATLTAENAALKNAAVNAAQTNDIVAQLKPCPVPAYIVANPCCNCGTNYGCGC